MQISARCRMTRWARGPAWWLWLAATDTGTLVCCVQEVEAAVVMLQHSRVHLKCKVSRWATGLPAWWLWLAGTDTGT